MKKYIITLCLSMAPLSSAVHVTVQSWCDEICNRSVSVNTSTHARARAGFFAEFNKVVSDLIYYESEGMHSFNVLWTHPFFPFKDDQKSNGWDLYFEPIDTGYQATEDTPIRRVGNTGTHELHDQKCVAHWVRYDDYLPYRLYAHNIINKYIKIKPHILEEVEAFYKKHMEGHVCIGIHIRNGKAHQGEAPGGHPAYHTYAAEIDRYLRKHKNEKVKIFLASDSHAVISYFKSVYDDKIVYLDTYRAQTNEDPGLMYDAAKYWMSHPDEFNAKKPGYRGGLGVLMDCLLLSKCDYFIHITSNVATYVCFFNPYIKSIYLPHNIRFRQCRHYRDPKVRNPFLNPI